MANLPQVIVTLAPNGTLIAELPGANGARRQVPLGPKPTRRNPYPHPAGPTQFTRGDWPGRCANQAQVKHWERHEIWADPTCRFCIAERGLHPRQKPKAVAEKPVVVSKSTASRSAGLAIRSAKPSSSGPTRPSRPRPRPSRWPSWNLSSAASDYRSTPC
jgi:hypothetical protein